ncbi:G2/mitotic-specific cyclin-B3 [Dromiciops gliroides]|uniref:G2/mitotic-specific cyclin-B3 n=1 Tax=Dromiciops gliroides TaxID=33562 RepID=UPI001CC392E8|nr:G2/mitotic-specific cyclin-B3 [Dromiciops gliroides]XP_043830337.1 G2/mitotic-specific cyclin-B3 [Dromiciops gliroides]
MPVPRNSRSANSKGLRSSKTQPMEGTRVEAVRAVESQEVDKEETSQAKRSPSSPQGAPKKRSAFGDLTNAHQNQPTQSKKEVKGTAKKVLRSAVAHGLPKNNEIILKKSAPKSLPEEASVSSESTVKEGLMPVQEEEAPLLVEEEPSVEGASAAQPGPSEMSGMENIEKVEEDPYANTEYAKEIFKYMRKREEVFPVSNYMVKQHDITKDMRAILVDWMVEVQENFELTHETLYLAVKLVDHYLMQVVCLRDKLQLIGSTAILIASKFEERCPPCIDDFLYICDDAYQREELLSMEVSILHTLNFDINIPIAYRFLRRFAKCAHVNMETLTLARFICELTLQEYDYVQERASKLAASCFFLALKMKNIGKWTPTLEHYSGYRSTDLFSLVKRLNFLLTYQRHDKLKAVRTKYSHKIFFEVAKTPTLDMLKLEESLKNSV